MSNSFIMTESIVRPAKMPYGRLKDNGFVGIEGEHAARALVVETKDDLSAFASINLIIDDLDCGAMTKTTSGNTTTLSMTLTSSMIGRSGRKICQLIMVNSGNTVVQKSSQFEAYVGRANEIGRSVDDGVTIIILSEAVTEMAQEAAAAAAQEAVADVVEDCQAIADAASASADAAAQSASDAQTAAESITVDATLDPTSTHAIQNKAVASEISSIKADLGDLSDLETTDKSSIVAAINEAAQSGGSSGLTDSVKTALMNLVSHIGAWTDENAQTYITALYDALYPPADLVSISAVYTQSGTVYDTDTLDSLKSDLVVTALMSDQTTRPVTSYTLSGTLTEGTSTITVTYGGQTTTFTVTVSHVKQVVRHYFSNLEYTDGKLIKTNKSQVSISNSGHVIIPYVQGMTVVTVMPSNWIGSYPAIMKDNGTSYSNANAVQGKTVSSNTFIYSQTFDDESGIENIVTNFQSTYISQCYYETEE